MPSNKIPFSALPPAYQKQAAAQLGLSIEIPGEAVAKPAPIPSWEPLRQIHRVWIPGNIPSLKNSKQIVSIPIMGSKKCGACGHLKASPRLVPSKLHKTYEKASANWWKAATSEWLRHAEPLPRPLRIGFQFYRDSHRRFDYTNSLDTVQDLMVSNKWIEDDCAEVMLPIVIPYAYSKENPGVWILLFS
jgi:hypothetical protein